MRLREGVSKKLKERAKRIFKRWQKRQGPFTQRDLDFRDKKLLFHVSRFAYGLGVTANQVTFAGFLLLFLWLPLRLFFAGELLF